MPDLNVGIINASIYCSVLLEGLPTEAYKVVEEIHDDGTPTNKTFEHVATEIGAEEAEEVGVEHLLRLVIFLFSPASSKFFDSCVNRWRIFLHFNIRVKSCYKR